MGVRGPGDAVDRIVRRPLPSHPHAHGPGFGFWVIQRKPAPALGWVLARSERGVYLYDGYARCRDDDGRRPWLVTRSTLGSAVAWMIQHEAEITRLIARSQPEPNDN